MQKLLLSLTFFAIYTSLFAQDKENIFLKREFWQANPSTELIKSKIAEGNDPCQQDEFGYQVKSAQAAMTSFFSKAKGTYNLHKIFLCIELRFDCSKKV